MTRLIELGTPEDEARAMLEGWEPADGSTDWIEDAELYWYEAERILEGSIDAQIYIYAMRMLHCHRSKVQDELGISGAEARKWSKLFRLPDHAVYTEQRRVLLQALTFGLRERDCKTYAQIGEATGTTPQAVSARHKRALRKSRKEIRAMWADALRSRGCTGHAVSRFLQNPAIAPSLAMLDGAAKEVA